jgi:prepilin signal peptidase PulO-like enzyme (type II secretory pathway)
VVRLAGHPAHRAAVLAGGRHHRLDLAVRRGRDRATPIPFGPYLAIAGWVVFFWGGQMVDAYLRFAGLRQ